MGTTTVQKEGDRGGRNYSRKKRKKKKKKFLWAKEKVESFCAMDNVTKKDASRLSP